MNHDFMPENPQTRWASFENPTGKKGAAAKANKGWKGRPFATLEAGETKTLLDVEGCGCINRIWMTLSDRSPHMLRAVRIDIRWDGASAPAVSTPLGDFFGAGLGVMAPFESEWFANAEGRSLTSYVPMPFYAKAVVTLTNESDTPVSHLFYDINYVVGRERPDRERAYFHAYWSRENPTALGADFEVLPLVEGSGRFMGMHVGITAAPAYKGSWWGEGEVKMFLDGDREFPTIAGTGTEDYVGTAWGQGVFAQRFQGCPHWDKETESGSFYRLHIPDPVCFREECRVTLQQIGGAEKGILRKFAEAGAEYRAITVDDGRELVGLLEDGCALSWEDERFGPKAWVNFLRRDDVSAVAYFYLNKPENGLPPLAAMEARVAGMKR